jgi:hypothetical protein
MLAHSFDSRRQYTLQPEAFYRERSTAVNGKNLLSQKKTMIGSNWNVTT